MHHHDHFWWRFFPKKELTRIYISTAMRFFATSLISLFIPIYLHLELGYSIHQSLYFYMFYAIIYAIICPIAAKFSHRFGVKHSVLLSIPIYLLFVLTLHLLPNYSIPLYLIAGLAGASQAFYWMGMHFIFHHASDRKHRGEEFGKRAALSISATLLGPLVGGFTIKYFGFELVFMLTGILLFVSAFFLFMSKEEHPKFHFSLRSLVDKRHWQNSLFFISRGSHVMTSGVIWPLFVFFILKDYASLGVVGSITAGISAILIFIVGKFSDHKNKHTLIRYFAGFESLAWFLRSMVSTVGQVFGITIFGGITYGLVEGPMGALEYDKATSKVEQYFVTREIYLCLGRVLVLLFV